MNSLPKLEKHSALTETMIALSLFFLLFFCQNPPLKLKTFCRNCLNFQYLQKHTISLIFTKFYTFVQYKCLQGRPFRSLIAIHKEHFITIQHHPQNNASSSTGRVQGTITRTDWPSKNHTSKYISCMGGQKKYET